MSHVVTLDSVEMRDLEAVRRMCTRLGWTFKEGQKTFRWYGQWLGDTEAPLAFMTPEERTAFLAMPLEERVPYLTAKFGHCDHAIEVPGCDYEIGLVATADSKGATQYWPVWDYFEVGGLHNVLGDPQDEQSAVVNPMPQAYLAESIKLDAERQGWSWSEESVNGKLVVKVGVY